MNWNYFDRFERVNNHYLPMFGEGETKATQIVTAVNKLVYKWYNDGDVFDNTHGMCGWCNDLSSYANWLRRYCGAYLLDRIEIICTEEEYEELLFDLANWFLNEETLEKMNEQEKVGSIYECYGPFKFDDEPEDEWEEEEEDWDEADEEEY